MKPWDLTGCPVDYSEEAWDKAWASTKPQEWEFGARQGDTGNGIETFFVLFPIGVDGWDQHLDDNWVCKALNLPTTESMTLSPGVNIDQIMECVFVVDGLPMAPDFQVEHVRQMLLRAGFVEGDNLTQDFFED